jgi:predicted nucleic acid-binding protein
MTAPNDAIFIETTTIVDATLKPEYQASIQSILASYSTKISSNYVRMELKRGVLQNLVYLHNKIVNCNKWSEVQDAVSRLSASEQRHKLSTVLEVLARFWATIESKTTKEMEARQGTISINDYFRKQSVNFLRLSIRRLWKKLDSVADIQLDPMSCFVDIQPVKMDGELLDNQPRTCDKSGVECRIKNFSISEQGPFEAILAELQRLGQNADSETKKRVKSLRKILRMLPAATRKFSNHRQNQAECWNCGDAILAVTAPAGAKILHRNPRHFDPICAALKKKTVTY